MKCSLPVVAACLLLGCGPTEETQPPAPAFAVTLQNVSMGGDVELSDGSTTDWVFAPGLIVVHEAGAGPFEPGDMAGSGLEALAEEGDNTALLAELDGAPGISTVRSLAAEDQETYEATALGPQGTANAVVDVPEGQRVSILMMFGMSNDVFVATPADGVEVPVGSEMVEISGEMDFWDAGTEVNEEPGLGQHQPGVSQGTGEDEMGVITRLEGAGPSGFEYPSAAEVLQVSIVARDN